MPMGTPSSTENGIAQLSYSAARHRNTNTSESARILPCWEPDSFSW